MRKKKLSLTFLVMAAVVTGALAPAALADGMFPVKIQKVASPAGAICVRYTLQPVQTEMMHLRISVDSRKMRVIGMYWRKPATGSVGWNEQFGGGRSQDPLHTATICARYRWKHGARAKRARVVGTYFFSTGGAQWRPFEITR